MKCEEGKVKIIYNINQEINLKLEEALDTIFKTLGFEFDGSGMSLDGDCAGVRDLVYRRIKI